MAEYIEREAVYNTLKAMYCDECTDEKCQMCEYAQIMFVLDNLPIADVQPVDKWISVNEALPIYDGLVLICYNDKTIRLAIYTEDGWYSDEGEPIMEQPDYWVRIPEPPKQ
ncbi:MAG: hypothetical protein J6S85_16330 [Methanobrevibacter sp.]|nr:hypothetical protein [Methanobrevibacter sp.]